MVKRFQILLWDGAPGPAPCETHQEGDNMAVWSRRFLRDMLFSPWGATATSISHYQESNYVARQGTRIKVMYRLRQWPFFHPSIYFFFHLPTSESLSQPPQSTNFGLWEESAAPGEIPRRGRKNGWWSRQQRKKEAIFGLFLPPLSGCAFSVPPPPWYLLWDVI